MNQFLFALGGVEIPKKKEKGRVKEKTCVVECVEERGGGSSLEGSV